MLKPLCLAVFFGCLSIALPMDSVRAQTPVPAQADAARDGMRDAPVAASKLTLLEAAAGAASAMPAVPHVKTRCQLQEEVAMALLAIDQPVRAAAIAQQIANWRRGVAFAAIARHCAQRGWLADAERWIGEAKSVLESADVRQEQDWRKDAIRSAMAAALQSIGKKDDAHSIAKRVVDPESGKLESLPLEPVAKADLDAHLRIVDEAIQASNMDVLVTTLGICAQVFDRDYAEVKVREACESRIHAAQKRIPIQIHIDLLVKLAASASAHKDAEKARELLRTAKEQMTAARWAPEDEVKVAARLAAAIAISGDRDGATQQVRAAFAVYETSRKQIADIWRAGCLRPVAEAWLRIGDVEKASLFYAKALEEGISNPNSRPRAQDLVATCLSMVANDFVPDAAMLQRIQAIAKGLGDPW
jgi:tetratricopeptide (TPR) repeat protein